MKNRLYSVFIIFLVLLSSINLALVYADNPTGDQNIDIKNVTNPVGKRSQVATGGFTLTNKASEARQVNFTTSILTGPGGATIPVSAVTFNPNPANIDIGSQNIPTFLSTIFDIHF